MNEMESHPLNLAHQQHRRADAHLNNHRYDEAMQCHHNAAELLLDAMKSTTSSIAIESITLQHNYHLKQKDLIQTKKEQYMRVRKAMDQIKCLGKDPSYNTQSNDFTKLPVAIYKTMNNADFLLSQLSSKTDNLPPREYDVIDGRKTEKTHHTVIEELQILNESLHSLIEKLLIQVEVLKDDNSVLKERVNFLEKERVKYLNLPCSKDDLISQCDISNISFEEPPKENSLVPAPQSKPVNKVPDRLPNFDLSALRDN